MAFVHEDQGMTNNPSLAFTQVSTLFFNFLITFWHNCNTVSPITSKMLCKHKELTEYSLYLRSHLIRRKIFT